MRYTLGYFSPVVKSEENRLSGQEIDRPLAAERLRTAAAKKRLTAAALARKLGKSRQLVAQWMRGEALPTGAAAQALPGLLGVEASWLFPTGDKTPVGWPGSLVVPRSVAEPTPLPWNGVERRQSAPFGLRGTDVATPAALLSIRACMQKGAGVIAAEIERIFKEGELDGTREGRAAIAAWLYETAGFFRRHQVAVDRLVKLAQDIDPGLS